MGAIRLPKASSEFVRGGGRVSERRDELRFCSCDCLMLWRLSGLRPMRLSVSLSLHFSNS